MPIQGLRFNIPNGGESHLSFQSTGSFTAYNPNDGVANIALDRAATALDYDHRLPSQSGGKFPGPINSYLSIFYVDQSGGGVGGQIIIYATPEAVNVPYFWSIGRASQSAGTILDISQGSLPQTPPANTTRLWVDGSGNLHLLSYTGVDKTVVDSATPLGGDLFGTIPSGHIALANGSYLYGKDSAGTSHGFLAVSSDNYNSLYCGTAGLLLVNTSNSARLWSVDNSGNLVMAQGSLKVGSAAVTGAVGDLGVSRATAPGSGVIYFGNNSGVYIFFDGTNWHIPGGSTFNVDSASIVAQGSLTSTQGNVYVVNNNCHYSSDGSNILIYASQPANGAVYTRGAAFEVQDWNGAWTPANALSWNAQGYGYALVCVDTNHSFYWNNAGLTQWTCDGVQASFRFYCPSGSYVDWQLWNFTPQGVAQYGFDCNQGGNPAPLRARYFLPSGSVGGWLKLSDRSGAQTNELNIVAHLYVNGSIYCTNLTQTSERDLKESLVIISPKEALGYVLDTRVSSYRYKWINPIEGSTPATPNNYGFIADELVEVCPEAVDLAIVEDKSWPTAINYGSLVPILWSAVRNLDARIQQLEQPTTVTA